MGLVMLFGLLGLIVISLILGYITPLGFWWWLLGIPVVLTVISGAMKGVEEVQELQQEKGKELVLVKGDKTDLPEWSHSKFATTEEIKISLGLDGKGLRLLDAALWAQEEEDSDPQWGYRIDYPEMGEGSRFFLRKLTILPEGETINGRRLKYEFLHWNGELADITQAKPVFDQADFEQEGIQGWEIIGIDKDWTLISAMFEYHHIRQIFLFDHQQQTLLPITAKRKMAAAKLEWGHDSYYMIASCEQPKQVYLTWYEKEKNYDDFFSARGHYLPRISQISLLTPANPTGELVSRIQLEQQGMVIATKQQGDKLIVNTLDERDSENKLERQWEITL